MDVKLRACDTVCWANHNYFILLKNPSLKKKYSAKEVVIDIRVNQCPALNKSSGWVNFVLLYLLRFFFFNNSCLYILLKKNSVKLDWSANNTRWRTPMILTIITSNSVTNVMKYGCVQSTACVVQSSQLWTEAAEHNRTLQSVSDFYD